MTVMPLVKEALKWPRFLRRVVFGKFGGGVCVCVCVCFFLGGYWGRGRCCVLLCFLLRAL